MECCRRKRGTGLRGTGQRRAEALCPRPGRAMTEIGFYHLLATPLERALPRLLERARAGGYRIVVRAASSERVEHLNALLWTYDEASFLPHGSSRDGNPATHPVWLSDHAENPNGATILFLVDGV